MLVGKVFDLLAFLCILLFRFSLMSFFSSSLLQGTITFRLAIPVCSESLKSPETLNLYNICYIALPLNRQGRKNCYIRGFEFCTIMDRATFKWLHAAVLMSADVSQAERKTRLFLLQGCTSSLRLESSSFAAGSNATSFFSPEATAAAAAVPASRSSCTTPAFCGPVIACSISCLRFGVIVEKPENSQEVNFRIAATYQYDASIHTADQKFLIALARLAFNFYNAEIRLAQIEGDEGVSIKKGCKSQ